MDTNSLLLTQPLNDIIMKAMKYEEMRKKIQERNIKYEHRKREEKDAHFLDKKKQYAKNYYNNNKDKVNKKQLERYYKKKNASSSEESE